MSAASKTATNDVGGVNGPDTHHTHINNTKVKVHFQAVGGAPILKRSKFQISADQRFSSVHTFLRKQLKIQENAQSNLFLYCQSAFVPSMDCLVGELRDSFAVRDELVIHYSLQEAWG
jgi:ubiquitin-like protein ATG12